MKVSGKENWTGASGASGWTGMVAKAGLSIIRRLLLLHFLGKCCYRESLSCTKRRKACALHRALPDSFKVAQKDRAVRFPLPCMI